MLAKHWQAGGGLGPTEAEGSGGALFCPLVFAPDQYQSKSVDDIRWHGVFDGVWPVAINRAGGTSFQASLCPHKRPPEPCREALALMAGICDTSIAVWLADGEARRRGKGAQKLPSVRMLGRGLKLLPHLRSVAPAVGGILLSGGNAQRQPAIVFAVGRLEGCDQLNRSLGTLFVSTWVVADDWTHFLLHFMIDK